MVLKINLEVHNLGKMYPFLPQVCHKNTLTNDKKNKYQQTNLSIYGII